MHVVVEEQRNLKFCQAVNISIVFVFHTQFKLFLWGSIGVGIFHMYISSKYFSR